MLWLKNFKNHWINSPKIFTVSYFPSPTRGFYLMKPNTSFAPSFVPYTNLPEITCYIVLVSLVCQLMSPNRSKLSKEHDQNHTVTCYQQSWRPLFLQTHDHHFPLSREQIRLRKRFTFTNL